MQDDVSETAVETTNIHAEGETDDHHPPETDQVVSYFAAAPTDWSKLPLKQKIKVYDYVTRQITTKPAKAKLEDCCIPVSTYFGWKRDNKIDAIKAAVLDHPDYGEKTTVKFHWKEYLPPDKNVFDTNESDNKIPDEDDHKNNSEYIWKVLKNENIPDDSLIIDGTNGEGHFTNAPSAASNSDSSDPSESSARNKDGDGDGSEEGGEESCVVFDIHAPQQNACYSWGSNPPQYLAKCLLTLSCSYTSSDLVEEGGKKGIEVVLNRGGKMFETINAYRPLDSLRYGEKCGEKYIFRFGDHFVVTPAVLVPSLAGVLYTSLRIQGLLCL